MFNRFHRRIKDDEEKARTNPMDTDDAEGQERAGKTEYKTV